MGSCVSAERRQLEQEQLRDRELNRTFQIEHKCSRRITNILVLGGPKAGKSTVIKQCRRMYGERITEQERQMYKGHIHKQCIDQMRMALCAHDDITFVFFAFIHDVEAKSQDIGESMQIPDDVRRQIFLYCEGFDLFLSALAREAAESIQNKHRSANELNDEIVGELKTLWNEPAIKAMYERRNVTKIIDSTANFWNMMDALIDPDYLPDEADIILVYDNHGRKGVTDTICVTPSSVDGPAPEVYLSAPEKYHYIDIQCQTSQRRKWIHCFDSFDSITAIIFVASLSCYDEVTYNGDREVNMMTHQLELFDEVVNDRFLSDAVVLLFLNKKDLFADKIKQVPLSICDSFGAYHGEPGSFDQTTRYIRDAFISLEPRRRIYVHYTCATDRDDINRRINEVEHIVNETRLMSAGLC